MRANLAHQERLRAPPFESFAHPFFTASIVIFPGVVHEVHAGVQRLMHDANGFRLRPTTPKLLPPKPSSETATPLRPKGRRGISPVGTRFRARVDSHFSTLSSACFHASKPSTLSTTQSPVLRTAGGLRSQSGVKTSGAPRFIGYAPAPDCFFPSGGWIGAARKPSASWPGFLRDWLNRVNPGRVDIPLDPTAACCSPFLCFAGFVIPFS